MATKKASLRGVDILEKHIPLRVASRFNNESFINVVRKFGLCVTSFMNAPQFEKHKEFSPL